MKRCGNEAPPTLNDGMRTATFASIPHSHLTRASQLFRFADDALYRAKNRGRNRVELERRADPWRGSTAGGGNGDPRTLGRLAP